MVIPPSSSFYAHFRRKTSGKSFLTVGKAWEGLEFSRLFCYTVNSAEMFSNEVTSMEQHGFIQDMLDVKVLILFVMAKLSYPVSLQKIYELCYQDDKLSYFDVSVAVPQMVQSGHLEQLPDETYRITDKGREHEEITCDAIAYPVMQRALTAVQRFNNQMQRKGLIETNVRKEESGDFIAELCLRDDAGILMRLELSAPTLSQARGLTRAYEKQADSIYQQMMTLLLGGSGEKHADV